MTDLPNSGDFPLSPTISVFLPVWNGADTIDNTVSHILAQTLRNFELLLLDDGSTDATWAHMKKWEELDPRVRAMQNTKNLGIITSLNRLGEMARGKYLAREDCGDFSASQRYEFQIDVLERHPAAVAVVTDYWLLTTDYHPLGLITMPASIEEALVHGNPVCHATLMMRASAFIKVGGYSDEFAHVEDYDLFWRLSRVGLIEILREPLFAYSLNPMGITFRNLKVQNYYAEKVRAKYANGPEPAPLITTQPLSESISRALYHSKIGLVHLAKGRTSLARKELCAAMRYRYKSKLAAYYAAALLPSAAINILRKLKGKPPEDSRTLLSQYYKNFPPASG